MRGFEELVDAVETDRQPQTVREARRASEKAGAAKLALDFLARDGRQ